MSARERRAKNRKRQRRTPARVAAPAAISGVLFAATLAGAPAPADAASLAVSQVANINTTAAGSNPREITVVGSSAYFIASQAGVGTELWKTDGTSAGTTLVDLISSGSGGFSDLANVSGRLYFTAVDSSGTEQLWTSDGTAAGTQQLTSGSGSAYPSYLTNLGGTLYFASGGALWESKGTAATTTEVASIGSSFGYAAGLTNVNGTLYFADGSELWKSDGTAGGTVQVATVPTSYGLQNLTAVNGTLYFTNGNDGALWRSDSSGTALVKSVTAEGLANLNGELIFESGGSVWTSDGTAAGTQAVSTSIRGPQAGVGPEYTVVNGNAFFFSQYWSGSTPVVQLWRTDGTSAGTVEVTDLSADGFNFSDLTNVGGSLFFDSTKGLMYDDGNPGASAVIVGPPLSLNHDPWAGYLANLNGTLLFAGNDGTHGSQLWKSDGTVPGTSQISDINQQGTDGSLPSDIVNVNGTIYFAANDGSHGDELWKSDGSASGTTLVDDIDPGLASSYPTDLTNFNGTLVFEANGQLYKSTGTAAGTAAISTPGAQYPGELTVVDGTLYFVGQPTGPGAPELWEFNGTTASPVTSTAILSWQSQLVNANGTLFFSAGDSSSGDELWKSTSSGTTLVDEISPGFSASSPVGLTALGSSVYFWANDGTHGLELWESDGSTTQAVQPNISPAPNNNYPPTAPPLTPVGGTVYFAGDDGTAGTELWAASGTSARMVDDVQSGSAGSYPTDLTNVNGELFFAASQSSTGTELWSSDGTAAGTKLVRDINPGTPGSSPLGLTNDNGLLVFAANDGTHGTELWQSDGTTSGTFLADDISPGPAGSMFAYYQSLMVPVGGTLFFVANDGTSGIELWKATISANNGGGGGSGGSSGSGGGSSGSGSATSGPGSSGSGASGSGSGGSGSSGGSTSNGGILPSLKFMSTKVSGTSATIALSLPGTSTGTYTVKVTLSVVETVQGGKVLGVAASDRTSHKARKKTVKKTVVVGSRTLTVSGGKTTTLSVALNGAGKKLLAVHHRLSVKLAASAKGKTLASKTITFTAPKKKAK